MFFVGAVKDISHARDKFSLHLLSKVRNVSSSVYSMSVLRPYAGPSAVDSKPDVANSEINLLILILVIDN